VLEQVLRGGRRATLKDQAGIDEPLERVLEPFFSEFRDRNCQFVGEFAADRGADLGNSLCRRAEPVEPRHQRRLQRRRHTEPRRGHRRGNLPAALGTGFEHRLGHLLDEERHSVRALDDLGDHIRRQQGGVADEPLDHRRTVAPPEPVQRDHRHMRLTRPGRLEPPVGWRGSSADLLILWGTSA
jgi:hypothetical protein